MVLEVVTVLLAAAVGAIAVLYAVPKGYFKRQKKSTTPASSTESHTSTPEQAQEVPAVEVSAVAEPSPPPTAEPSTPHYEVVQPSPAQFSFGAPSTTSFGAPSVSKKPTRTYRRRTAPVRGPAGSKKTLVKPKKE
jgi:hypothetical protein